MLRITADVYSGQPNPVVEIADEGEARALLRELRQDPTLLSDAESTEGGLGFRGFHVEPLSDEIAQDFNIPSSLYLPARVLTRGGRAPEIAERLLDLMERGDAPALMEAPHRWTRRSRTISSGNWSVWGGSPPRTMPHRRKRSERPSPSPARSNSESSTPVFWNNDPNVRAHNNCYNYASNWRSANLRAARKGLRTYVRRDHLP